MFQALTDPLTDRLVDAIPGVGPQVEAARAAAGDSIIWSGAQLSGEPLRHALGDVAWWAFPLGLLAGGLLVCLLAYAWIAFRQGARKASPVLLCAGLLSFIAFALWDAVNRQYADILDRATTAVAISPTRIVLADAKGRTDIPATALTRVSRVNGERAVTLRFQLFQSLRIEPGVAEYGALDGAADRLAEEAGSRAPLKRDSLG